MISSHWTGVELDLRQGSEAITARASMNNIKPAFRPSYTLGPGLMLSLTSVHNYIYTLAYISMLHAQACPLSQEMQDATRYDTGAFSYFCR